MSIIGHGFVSHGPRRPAHDPNTPRPPVCATPTCAGNSPHRPSPSFLNACTPQVFLLCQHQGQGRPPSFRCRVAITAYQNEGHTVEDQHLAHISPARFEHINPYSTYNLNVEAVLQRIRHRPLKPAQPIRRSTTRRFGTNDQPPPRRQHLRTPNPEPPATEGSSAAGEQPWTRFPSVSGQLRPQYVAACVPRGGFRADIHQHPAPER